MKPEQIDDVRTLLTTQRVLALSVLVEGAPYVGLLPFVVTADYAGVLIHASRLARHTRGLLEGGPFGALIHHPDRPDSDPLQLPRLTLQGDVEALDRASAAYTEGRRLFEERFPSSAQTFLLGDFGLYLLRFKSGRYVGGFAQAANMGPVDFAKLPGG